MRHLIAALFISATSAAAQEAPKVVTDIAPIRALVAQVMQGVGMPDQIIPTGASPHGYAMRPSEARALTQADLVVWVGPALTHWLEEPLDTLSGQAERLTLMAHPGTRNLPMRVAAAGEQEDGHDHKEHGGHEHEEHDDHDHKDQADEGHDHQGHDHEGHDQKGHEDHTEEAHDHSEGHAHDHGPIDPHGWMSPANAVLWAGVVAQKLSQMDPANAAVYTRNWDRLRDEVAQLEQDLGAAFTPVRDTPFIVLHDAFYYFEATFGVEADAFVIGGDGQTPGPARLKAIRDQLAQTPAACAFVAPQQNDALLKTVIEGQGTRLAVLDPLGDGQTPYSGFLREFAQDMLACLEQG